MLYYILSLARREWKFLETYTNADHTFSNGEKTISIYTLVSHIFIIFYQTSERSYRMLKKTNSLTFTFVFILNIMFTFRFFKNKPCSSVRSFLINQLLMTYENLFAVHRFELPQITHYAVYVYYTSHHNVIIIVVTK